MITLKTAPVLLLACLASAVHAQTPPVGSEPLNDSEKRIYWAYERLRDEKSLFVQLAGTDNMGRRSISLDDSLYWFDEGTTEPKIKVELKQNRAGRFVHRVVADGTTLWNYNPVQFEYGASVYGTYGAVPGNEYTDNLFGLLYATTQGQSAYIARLLREVFRRGDSPIYRSWAPGYTPFEPSAPITDPIVRSRTYTPINSPVPTLQYVMYGTDNDRTARSVVFELTRSDDSSRDENHQWVLSRIFYAERAGSGALARITDWTMQLVPGPIPSTTNFTPYPKDQTAGWKTVVGPRPVKIQ